MAGPQTPETVSTKFVRIAELAKRMPSTALRTPAHHSDIAWSKEAHARVRKDGAWEWMAKRPAGQPAVAARLSTRCQRPMWAHQRRRSRRAWTRDDDGRRVLA